VHDPKNQHITRIIEVSSSLWSLTLQARLRHPLLCYTVPRVIHLSLPRISRTRRVSETSLSLTVEVSLTFSFSLSRHPFWPVLPQHTSFYGDHGLSQGSHVTTIAFFHAFQLDNHHLSLPRTDLSSHLYHMHTINL
jgi:hypothetical protein